jgi:hypothetical protein
MLLDPSQQKIPAIRAAIKNPLSKDSFIIVGREGQVQIYTKKKDAFEVDAAFIFTDAKRYPTLPHFLIKSPSSFTVGGDDGLVKSYAQKSGEFYEDSFPPLIGADGFLSHVFCGAFHDDGVYAFGIDDETLLFFSHTKKGQYLPPKRVKLPEKDTLYTLESVGDFFIAGGELGILYTYSSQGDLIQKQKIDSPLYDIKKISDYDYTALTEEPALYFGKVRSKKTKKIRLPEKGESLFFNAFTQTLYIGTDSGNVFSLESDAKKVKLLTSSPGTVTAITGFEDTLVICGEKWIDILEL